MTLDVIEALLDRRSALAGQIEVAQLELRRLIRDLDNVDGTIRVFAPHLSTEATKLSRIPPQHQALRGAVKTTLLATLKAATGPITTEVIAKRLLSDRQLPLNDPQLRDIFIRRAGQALFVLAKKGRVRRSGTIGRFTAWEIVE